MKYAIIAAGEGSRLASEGVKAPKPLVTIHGEALIDRLLRIFMENDATSILVLCNDLTMDVSRHLVDIQNEGLHGRPIPLSFYIKTTPSSMHSFYELSKHMTGDPFILTTVDTIFKENEFAEYVKAFNQDVNDGFDGVMGVTDFIDDERPLYVGTDGNMNITGFYDEIKGSTTYNKTRNISGLDKLDAESLKDKVVGDQVTGNLVVGNDAKYISGGIYGLTAPTLDTLNRCIGRGERRMRNFQRALVAEGKKLRAWSFSKVLDIDHKSDIQKAEEFLK